ncbi:MAG: ATP-dependent helicase, partial [Verrucomicrobiota bacterium]
GLTSKSALYVPDRLNFLYSYSRNTCKPPTEVFEPVFKGNTKKMVKATQVYEELKRAANVVDYDDLLVLWVHRMKNDPEYTAKLRERWKYVLVDEMQDNNRLNEAVLDALNPPYLMGVGDANQSIYGFRGSDVRIISEFGAKNENTKILKLENNYRSGQKILDLANIIVSKTECPLTLTSSQDEPGRIEYNTFVNPQQEALAITEWIKKHVEAGKHHSHLAILARSSRHLDPVEIALISKRIFFKKYGGQTLADSAEVKDFISFLRVAHNPLDKIALLRALMLFPGIGEGTAAKTIAAHQGEQFNTEEWPVSAKELIEWVTEIQRIKKIGDQGIYLYDKIRPLIQSNYPKDCDERNNTIHNLVEAMKGSPDTSLAEFLDGFILSRSSNDFHPDDAVVISTVHSAKGLEWEGVWLVGCGATQIPHPRTLN